MPRSPTKSAISAPRCSWPVSGAGEHVADVEGVGGLGVGVVHRGEDGVVGQVAQRPVPMLVDRGLADADDAYITHSSQCSMLNAQFGIAH